MEPNETSAARRRLAALSLAALSAITGVISYSHGLDVVRWVGNAGLVAYLVPLVPDLMIVTSSLTLIEAAAVKAKRPWMAMVSLVAGVGWTVAMNVAAGWRNGAGGALVAGGVPVAFVVTFESLLWLRRRAGQTASMAVLGQRKPPTMDEALAVLVESGSRRAVAELVGVPKARVDSWAARLRAAAEAEGARAAAAAAATEVPQPAGRPGRRWWPKRQRVAAMDPAVVATASPPQAPPRPATDDLPLPPPGGRWRSRSPGETAAVMNGSPTP